MSLPVEAESLRVPAAGLETTLFSFPVHATSRTPNRREPGFMQPSVTRKPRIAGAQPWAVAIWTTLMGRLWPRETRVRSAAGFPGAPARVEQKPERSF